MLLAVCFRRKTATLTFRLDATDIYCMPRHAVARASMRRKYPGFDARSEQVHEEHQIAEHVGWLFFLHCRTHRARCAPRITVNRMGLCFVGRCSLL